MHLFDIRRSNSVTELWKRFEKQDSDTPGTDGVKSSVVTTEEYSNDKPASNQAPATLSTASVFTSGENPLLSGYEAELANLASHARPYLPKGSQPTSSADAGPNAPGVATEESQPLMAAFEAELASLMGSTDDSTTRGQQTASSPQSDHGTDSTSQQTPHPVEILAAQVITHLANGANMVHSEFAARLPELQRQLHDAREQLRDAQRTLPENVRMSLHTLLATIEAQMKVALGSLPTGGRQFAEEALHAGRPVAENAADGFRTIASDFSEFGKSLYAAFEEEFGRAVFAPIIRSPSAPSTTGAAASYSANDCPPPSESTSQNAETQPMDSKREVPVAGQTPVFTHETINASAVPSEPENSKQGAQADRHFPLRYHRGPHVHMRPPHSGSPPQWVGPPPHPAHCGHPPPPPFWPSLGHLPWNFPPTRHGYHHPVPPPHPRPPPPPPYPGRWPVPDSFGHLFNTPNNHHNKIHPSSVDIPSKHADLRPEGENKTLFIGNIGFNVSEKMIEDVFASKGFIVKVDLPLDATSGKHAGFGYLHFPSKYPAMAAIDALQGERIDGYAINLEFSENAPIENVLATSNSNSDGTPHNDVQFGPKQTNSGSLRQNGSIKRRKSVSFEEPTSQMEEASNINSSNVPPRVGSPQLIDLSFEDASGSACDSSRQVKNDSEHEQANEDEAFSNFNPEKEMSRFPPVSQLEAQLLAKHHQDRATPASIHSDPAMESPLRRSLNTSSVHEIRPLVHPSLEEMRYDSGQPNPSASVGTPLRRSSTMVFSHPRLQHPVPSDDATYPRLKRHASERHSLRPSTETDTWARLDRRERRRSRPLSEQSIPGSFPVGETTQPSASQEPEGLNTSEIEACVSSLIDMGYGTAEEGGRSRMAVYAAASNGSLLDAIEMIEEERKVYAKHDQV